MNLEFDDDEDDEELDNAKLDDDDEAVFCAQNKSREETLEFSFNLARDSIFDLIKNNQDSCFQCHAIARIGANSLDTTKSRLELLMTNARKNSNKQNEATMLIQTRHGAKTSQASLETEADRDFNSLSATVSPQSSNLSSGTGSKSYDENDSFFNSDSLKQITNYNCTFDGENTNFFEKILQNTASQAAEALKKDDFEVISGENVILSSKDIDDFDLLS